MPEARAITTGKDEVIKDGAIKGLGRRRETAGRAAIAGARARIAARMVVCKNHARASMKRGIGDDLSQGEIRSALVSLVARNVKAACIFVDMRDPQALERCVVFREASGEEVARRGQAVEL